MCRVWGVDVSWCIATLSRALSTVLACRRHRLWQLRLMEFVKTQRCCWWWQFHDCRVMNKQTAVARVQAFHHCVPAALQLWGGIPDCGVAVACDSGWVGGVHCVALCNVAYVGPPNLCTVQLWRPRPAACRMCRTRCGWFSPQL